MTTKFAQLDNRKRVNLSAFAQSDLYTITTEPSGRIILDPAIVITQVEQDFRENAKAVAAVEHYFANPDDVIEED